MYALLQRRAFAGRALRQRAAADQDPVLPHLAGRAVPGGGVDHAVLPPRRAARPRTLKPRTLEP